jgi:hypothetical protein
LLAILFSSLLLINTAQKHSYAQGAAGVLAKDIQSMTYEVYAGGINAVVANLDIKYTPEEEYSFEFSAKTQGFLGKVAPWEGSFETFGWAVKDKIALPELHKSVSVWKSEEEIKEYKYGKDGSFHGLHITDPHRDNEKIKVEDELTNGTTDALSATLHVLQKVSNGEKCEGVSEVFDGKRRFKLMFSHENTEVLNSSRYNVFEGEASRCVVEIEPISGAWHKKPRGWLSIQEQGREKGTLPTVWVAKIGKDGPAVPVKVRVKTEYGTLFMHLVKYKNGNEGATLVQN